MALEKITQYFIGRDDGQNFGPFETTEGALEWATRQCTADEVRDEFRDEAEFILTEWKAPNGNDHREYLLARMMDLVTNVDWVLFAVVMYGGGDWSSVLDEDETHDPEASMY